MDIELGKGKTARRVYGFDEISLSPSIITINPDDTDTSIQIAWRKLDIPILASAMDSVVSPQTAALMSQYGGLGALNLQGLQFRFEDADAKLKEIAACKSPAEYVALAQRLYDTPLKEELVKHRIQEVKKRGGIPVVSSIPQRAAELGPIARDAGAEIFIVQSTVISTKHKSTQTELLDLPSFCKEMDIPILVGNCVSYPVALTLMATGVAGVLVGVGAGHACTSR